MCAKCSVCLLIAISLSVVRCRTIWSLVEPPTAEELTFLKRYGYLLEGEEQVDADFAYTPHSISEALKKMQNFAGLPETGAFDTETKELFNKKRCGVKDILSTESSRTRRYIVQQAWTKKSISYRVLNGTSTLDKARVEELMANGLAVWAPHGGLHFHKQDEGRADIQVSFVAGPHGDGYPFDGPGHVVAHAFPPPHGAMHFDDDELWGDNPEEDDEDATDFYAVAVHEIGHALGLGHSKVKSSVMYPYYQVAVERLHTDDIRGMQELYKLNDEDLEEITDSPSESRSSIEPRLSSTKASSEDENYIPDLCMTNFDTLQVLQGKIFVFEEEWVWMLEDRHKIADGYPQRFLDVFLGLPATVTIIKTIYEKENGNIVIFSGRDYWEFNPSFQAIKESTIDDYLIPEEVTDLTTVFLSNYNNKTYLIEEERYWRYDERTGTMDEGYPKDMSMWRQVPYPVDAAIVWKGDTYFFQGPRFWRFDNMLVQAHDYYPLPTAQVWFPCDSTPDMNRYITNDGP